MSDRLDDADDGEPFYIAQDSGANSMTSRERADWFVARNAFARASGSCWARATYDRELGIVLFEAWFERPADEGKPRFRLGVH